MNNVVDMSEARLRKADEEFGQRMAISTIFVPHMMGKLPLIRQRVADQLAAERFKSEVLEQEERRARMDAEVNS